MRLEDGAEERGGPLIAWYVVVDQRTTWGLHDFDIGDVVWSVCIVGGGVGEYGLGVVVEMLGRRKYEHLGAREREEALPCEGKLEQFSESDKFVLLELVQRFPNRDFEDQRYGGMILL